MLDERNGDPVGAIFSDDCRYRYFLDRVVQHPSVSSSAVAFLMLNPSTADALRDDRTIRRCINYSKAWGYGRLNVVNLCPLRATHPTEILKPGAVPPEVEAENFCWILCAARASDKLILAYGAHGKTQSHADHVVSSLTKAGIPLYYLILTEAGYPSHPLRLKATLTPKPWKWPQSGRAA